MTIRSAYTRLATGARRPARSEHGFARIRCDACAHEYLLAFSCKSRYFGSGPTAGTAALDPLEFLIPVR